MSNVAQLLREEIRRLCRREIRKVFGPVQRAGTAHRRELAAAKRSIQDLARRIGALSKQIRSANVSPDGPTNGQRVRFVAKGLRPLRTRLGLSAAEFGRLVGVGAQSVYNWEQRKAAPRSKQVTKIAALRSLGKREAHRRLAELGERTRKVRNRRG